MRKINASRNSTYIKFDPFVSPSLLRVSEKLSLSILDFPFQSPTCAESRFARARARARIVVMDFIGPRVPRVTSSPCIEK